MSDQDLKKFSRRAIELWNSNNPDQPEDLVTESYQNHQQPEAADGTGTTNLKAWKEVLESYHEDVVSRSHQNHRDFDTAGGRGSKDLKGWKDLLKSYHEAFSNSKVDILSQIVEDDMVATRWRATADHTGKFGSHPPTRKKSTWTGVTIDRFDNGKIAESWINWDKYSFLKGFGLIK
jgi:predicted ester cyclase